MTQVANENALAELISSLRYSPEEKEQFSRIIRDFNALYHRMCVQTWGSTKWRGVQALKPPTDMWVYQELICMLKPDLIIETGTFAGGSALFMRDVMDKEGIEGIIVTIDISDQLLHEKFIRRLDSDLRFFNMSSIDIGTLNSISLLMSSIKCERVMVVLDSSHEKEHVLTELELYAPLVTVGSALVVEDTSNHDGARSAMDEWFLRNHQEFKRDYMCEKFMLTFSRDGFFERIA